MSIKVQRFVCNMFQENCYVVSDDTNECVIIDCGALYPEERMAISQYIKENCLTVKHLVCTHGHVDHNFGNNFIYTEYGLQPEVCSADKKLMKSLRWQAKAFVNLDYKEDIPPVGLFLSDGDVITFGTHSLSVISTPGHSPGSAVLYCEEENIAFTGDTVFRMSIGRTDLEDGRFEEIISSLHSLTVRLPSDTLLMPGHGPQTTMSDELKYNPYMK